MLKVTIQTLKNQKFPLSIPQTHTIQQVKQAVHTELKLGEPEEQKLIHQGKILKDDSTVSANEIKNNDSIVVMISKKKGVAAPQQQAQAVPAQPIASNNTASQAQTTTSTAPATSTAAPSASSASASSSADASAPAPIAASVGAPVSAASSSLVTGDAHNETIVNLMGLGFERDQVVAALRAAFNNPDRAADYLFNGIPASAAAAATTAEQRQPSAQAQQAASASSETAAPSGSGAAEAGSAAALAGLGLGGADLTQLRQMIQSNPDMLHVLLERLASDNPELVSRLQEHPEELHAVLSALGVQVMPAGGRRRGNVHRIEITPEESAQLDNLVALGFSRDAALEAWLACDRNFELAAAYLLDHGADMMDDAQAAGIEDEAHGDYHLDEHDHEHGDYDDDDELPDQDYAE